MRHLILGDIHANLEALQAVIDDATTEHGFDQIWGIGDLVGYGPNPNEVIGLVRQYGFRAVAGNHDFAAIDKIDYWNVFNPHAAWAAKWTGTELTDENREFLKALPEMIVVGNGKFTITHGSPRGPIDEYVTQYHTARECFKHFDTPYCLISHTHQPLVFAIDAEENLYRDNLCDTEEFALTYNQRMLINPGSVGQPRDNNFRASYMIYDDETETMEHYRVAYEYTKTQLKLAEINMPTMLIERLAIGC